MLHMAWMELCVIILQTGEMGRQDLPFRDAPPHPPTLTAQMYIYALLRAMHSRVPALGRRMRRQWIARRKACKGNRHVAVKDSVLGL